MSMFFNFGHTCDDGGECDECNKVKEKTGCEHEPDLGLEKAKKLIGWGEDKWGKSFKCVKCGEFYK